MTDQPATASLSEEQLRRYARASIASLATAGLDTAQWDGPLPNSADLERIEKLIAASTVVVLLSGDLDGTDAASPGPWEVVPLQVARFAPPGEFRYRDVATIIGGTPDRYTVGESVDGNALFRLADARLIAALHKAYTAATVPSDTTEENA